MEEKAKTAPITASQMLDELDARTLPKGKLHFFPQVYVTGAKGMNMKKMRYRGIQPCDCKGNPEEHVFPVKITNILELNGHPIDWSNGYNTLNPQPSTLNPQS